MSSDLNQEIAARLQEEHRALLQLSQVLREHIAATPQSDHGPWLDGLRVAFDRLHAHIERSLKMKTADGYLAVIVKEHPNLARQTEAIQAEHAQLLRMAEGIKNDLAGTRPEDRLLVADCCARVQRFMAVVSQHEQRENMIVMFAFNQDLGVH